MKVHFLVCCLFLSVLSKAQQPLTDVLHYRFYITLSDKSDLIKGRAFITVKLLQGGSRVVFDLASSMHCSGVREKGRALKKEQTDRQLAIVLPGTAAAGDIRTFEILYEGIPADGLIIDKNKYGHRTFFADNWPNRAHLWIPCKDDPADKASVEFIVTAPAHYQVISNGIQTAVTITKGEKTTQWKEDRPLPTKIMVIGVADFAVEYAGTVENVPVYSWVYPEEKEKGFYDYGQATAILPFFVRHVAPFPFKKLANVQSTTIFGGMENAGAIFYAERSVTGTRAAESLLAHEIAHQWFGDMATEASWPHLWLSEGFATYLSMLYMESKYGADTLKYQLLKSKEKIFKYARKSFRPVVDTAEKNYMQLLNANSYDKGAWVLHMLRMQLGDSVFWRSVRTYYASYAGRNAVTDDLRKIFEEVSDRDLQLFFQQWLFTAGHPVLKMSWKYDSLQNIITGTIVQEQTPAFGFPLEIGLYGPDNKKGVVHTLIVKYKATDFTIPVAGKVTSVVIDPFGKLLYEESGKKEK